MRKILLFLLIFSNTYLYSQTGITEGFISGTTSSGVNDPSGTYDGDMTWANPNNLVNAGSTGTSSTTINSDVLGNNSGNWIITLPYLIGVASSFSIPANATISGFSFEQFVWQNSTNGSGVTFTIQTQSVSLCYGSNASSCSSSYILENSGQAVWPGSSGAGYETWGSSTNLEGQSISASEINAGVAIKMTPQNNFTCNGCGGQVGSIDSRDNGWSVTIYYTIPSAHIPHALVGPVIYHQTRKVKLIQHEKISL